MKSFQGIFIILFIIAIPLGNAEDDYHPVYFKIHLDEYNFIYNVGYNAAEAHYVVKAPNEKILVACPSLDEDSDFFVVREIVQNEANVLPICEKSNKSRILKARSDFYYEEDIRRIGFLIRELPHNVLDAALKGNSNLLLENDIPVVEKSPSDKPDEQAEKSKPNQVRPKATYKTLDLIVFKYDNSLNRIKFAWYNIAPGKLLEPELSLKKDEIYETNKDIYGYDVDFLYFAASETGSPYIKVPLAPEEDFLFEYVKSASRQNILTAPMRHELRPHWQNLEIFTRKVTQIIDSVAVMAGIHGTLTQPDEEFAQQTIYLHNGKYAIPSLFWKVIFIEFSHQENFYRNGIIFVLHNVDPNVDQDVEKICPDDEDAVSNTGWRLPVDDKFKRLMYACLWNPANMKMLGENEEIKNEVFNLNKVPTKRIQEDGTEIFEIVNVIERINQNSGIKWLLKYFVDAFSYSYGLLSSNFYIEHYPLEGNA